MMESARDDGSESDGSGRGRVGDFAQRYSFSAGLDTGDRGETIIITT